MPGMIAHAKFLMDASVSFARARDQSLGIDRQKIMPTDTDSELLKVAKQEPTAGSKTFDRGNGSLRQLKSISPSWKRLGRSSHNPMYR